MRKSTFQVKKKMGGEWGRGVRWLDEANALIWCQKDLQTY